MAYDMYQEIILQHYRAPHHFGPLDHPTLSGEESNPLCGDHIRMDLRLDGPEERVGEVKFSGDGCAISVASASMLTDRIQGKPLAEVKALTQDDVIALVGIPLSPVRIKCALTGFAALGRALAGGPPSSATAEPAREAT
ncbi:MAG TPA: iron-sulfur cluster assembly scaffold protein [Thermoplasmata archaeon]|nr:iron-sulfur cluster assembly scaffold protein [Thermoplasmata archaeon]